MSEELYKQRIIDRYQQPQFQGKLERPTMDVSESNPLCGDWLRFQLHVAGNRVDEIRWQGEGCAISLASADLLSERIKGLSLDDINQITEDDVIQMLGIELKPSRMKCTILSLHCIKKASP